MGLGLGLGLGSGFGLGLGLSRVRGGSEAPARTVRPTSSCRSETEREGEERLGEMRELVRAFTLLCHERVYGALGVPIALGADFARFCLAWRLFAYFNTPKLKRLERRPRRARGLAEPAGASAAWRRTAFQVVCA